MFGKLGKGASGIEARKLPDAAAARARDHPRRLGGVRRQPEPAEARARRPARSRRHRHGLRHREEDAGGVRRRLGQIAEARQPAGPTTARTKRQEKGHGEGEGERSRASARPSALSIRSTIVLRVDVHEDQPVAEEAVLQLVGQPGQPFEDLRRHRGERDRIRVAPVDLDLQRAGVLVHDRGAQRGAVRPAEHAMSSRRLITAVAGGVKMSPGLAPRRACCSSCARARWCLSISSGVASFDSLEDGALELLVERHIFRNPGLDVRERAGIGVDGLTLRGQRLRPFRAARPALLRQARTTGPSQTTGRSGGARDFDP